MTNRIPPLVLGALTVLGLLAIGCETNHPQEAAEISEVRASDLSAPPGEGDNAWWIKVCPTRTQASWFRISVGPDDHNITQKIVWRQGDPLEFNLLSRREYNQIYVVGYSGEDGKTAFFGVCHGSQVCCRHFEPNQTETTGGEGHAVKSGDTDVWDCK